ncbi:hypothetical protein TWF481_007225 [Arthrobotrys musiformis]|uniref:Uncharacterized protein n=1 Tax=Arthrobotrys musiformis TaxID=47236 RepID=A0AAV9WD62_9PEZI
MLLQPDPLSPPPHSFNIIILQRNLDLTAWGHRISYPEAPLPGRTPISCSSQVGATSFPKSILSKRQQHFSVRGSPPPFGPTAMRQSFHRYLLPPALLIVHALLLLPILIPYKPDNSPNPESSLQVALNSARYAFPLACVAFATTYGLRLLARSQALSPSESRVAWVVLFSLGVAEEVLRWSIVRYLSNLEGGGGGYGAKNPEPKHRPPSIPGTKTLLHATSVEVEPGIWEGVYLMGWLWSALECIYTWWSLAPCQTSSPLALPDVEYPVPISRPHSYHSWRKEHSKKRSTDSTIRTIRGLSRKSDIPFTNPYSASLEEHRYQPANGGSLAYQGLLSKFEDRASSPELSRRIAREEDNDAGDEETSATDNDNDPLDSPLTPTAYRPSYHAAVPAQPPRQTTDEDDDQEESTPTQQKHNARFLMPGPVTSDSDYFGGREPAWTFSNQISPKRHTPEPTRRLSALISDTETESLISGAQTPLLSSSIPLDQEQTSLLDHPRGLSYGSTQQLQTPLGTLLPPPLDTHLNKLDVTNRPSITSHPSYLSITTGDEAEDESDTQGNGGSFGRAYPSHPAFSSSYIHQHFPSPNLSNTTYGQLTPTNNTIRLARPKIGTSNTLPIRRTKTKRPRSFPGIPLQHTPPVEPLLRPPRYSRRCFHGVEVNSVPFILAILWVVIVAFQHIAYGLWFVWFPTPVFEDVVQGWSIIFFVVIAFSKGAHVALINSGWIVANGLLWLTTFACIVISFVLYFIALVLWGVLW